MFGRRRRTRAPRASRGTPPLHHGNRLKFGDESGDTARLRRDDARTEQARRILPSMAYAQREVVKNFSRIPPKAAGRALGAVDDASGKRKRVKRPAPASTSIVGEFVMRTIPSFPTPPESTKHAATWARLRATTRSAPTPTSARKELRIPTPTPGLCRTKISTSRVERVILLTPSAQRSWTGIRSFIPQTAVAAATDPNAEVVAAFNETPAAPGPEWRRPKLVSSY